LPSSSRAGQSIGTPGFAEETRRYLQGRLVMLTGALGGILGVLSLGFIAQLSASYGLLGAIYTFTTSFPNSILVLLLSMSLGCFALLRVRRWGMRILSAVDGLFLAGLVAACLYLYDRLHFFSFSGFAAVVPFLALFILARAVLVPSTALRTLAFSFPAALGVLLVQLRHGASFVRPGEPFPSSHFVDSLVQNQVILLGSCAVAVVASRVNLGLRRSRFDARTVGQYKMGKRLGQGAMGEVYLATHSMLKRPTAIKLLQPKVTGEAALHRFEREVRQTSRLTHPNTVSIFDYGHTADGVFYYAMEYLEGATLASIVRSTGPLSAARTIHVLSAACGALAEAHGKGLVHRDIKPANIMLCERGNEMDVVKLLDFGLVQDLSQRDTTHQGLMGTPETMAPEIIQGKPVGPPADLYALGTVAYYLLTGQPVFEGMSLRQLLRAHESQEPLRPSELEVSIPADLEQIVLWCLHKDPGDRPASAEELRRALMACADAGKWSDAQAADWWKRYRLENPQEPAADEAPLEAAETIVVPQLRG